MSGLFTHFTSYRRGGENMKRKWENPELALLNICHTAEKPASGSFNGRISVKFETDNNVVITYYVSKS
jgi:hypothetical protein